MPVKTFASHVALDALARAQDGVVTYRQLVEIGLPSSTLAHRVRTDGPWQRLLPGTYLLFSGAPSWRQRVRAALLYAGQTALVTGQSALRLYGFKSASLLPSVHVLIDHQQRRVAQSSVRVERSHRMPAGHEIAGLPCVPAERAVADACLFLRPLQAVRAVVAEGVQSRHCDVAALWNEVINGPMRGSAYLRRAVREVSGGAWSAPEIELAELLTTARVATPLLNAALYSNDGTLIGIPDGYLPEYGIAYEVNSVAHHLDRLAWEETQRRHDRLTAAGLIVLHLTPQRIRDAADEVLSEFRGAIRSAEGRVLPQIVVGDRP
jgi:hypothetical protein